MLKYEVFSGAYFPVFSLNTDVNSIERIYKLKRDVKNKTGGKKEAKKSLQEIKTTKNT